MGSKSFKLYCEELDAATDLYNYSLKEQKKKNKDSFSNKLMP
jgi:hypothetical protein